MSSMDAQRLAGGSPRAFQLDTVCTDSPSRRASADGPPDRRMARSIAVSADIADSLHDTLRCGQRDVLDGHDTARMPDAVWVVVDEELSRRKLRHLAPSSWAALGRVIHATDQQMHNWKVRGIPARHHLAIAMAFGWTVDQLLGIETPSKSPPYAVDAHGAQEDAEEVLNLFRRLSKDGQRDALTYIRGILSGETRSTSKPTGLIGKRDVA